MDEESNEASGVIPNDEALTELTAAQLMDLAAANGLPETSVPSENLANLKAKRDGGAATDPKPVGGAVPHIPVDETLAQMDDTAVLDMAIAHGLPADDAGDRVTVENYLRIKRDGQ